MTRAKIFYVPRIAFYFLMAYATMFLSNVMSNTATSTVLIPLGIVHSRPPVPIPVSE